MSDWKPGDVAMVTIPDRGDVIAMYMDGGDWETPYAEGDGRTTYRAFPAYCGGLVGRPLVVIDPEDREAVERLADLNERATPDGLVTPTASTDAMQAALREFANPKPPKPDEPQGLGAVVEDAEGCKWVRADGDDLPWVNFESSGDYWLAYADLDVVRVLSEGVRP